MSFFSNILEKLGLKKDKPAETTAPAATAHAAPAAGAAARQGVDKGEKDNSPLVSAASTPAAAKPAVAAMSEVDVVAKLEKMAAGSGLDWKVSIVDMLKVLGIDSSREARNELAKELGCPAELMSDSAKMNVWLHKEVLKRIAANGGNIPANMLD